MRVLLAGRLRSARGPRHCRGLSLRCRGSQQAEEELLLLPEYREARDLLAAGKPSQSVPLLQRTREVVSEVLRGSPLHSALVAHRLSLSLLKLGQIQRAGAVWKEGKLEGFAGLHALRMMSLCHLLSGDVQEALLAAESAVSQSERESFEEADLEHVFSPSYGMLGICQFFAGESEEAETHLQKAARWATDDPLLQAISSGNLGERPP